MANDLSDLDGTEGGPQPAQGRELVIVDLGHAAIMAGASGRCPAGVARDSIHLRPGYDPGGTGSDLWGRDRDRTGRAEPARVQGRWPAQWLVGAPGGAVAHRPTDPS